MSTLITGGAGFIGSHFVELLVKKYTLSDIIVVDNLTYAGDMANLEDVKDKITFVLGNISNKATTQKLFKKYDIRKCYNFAAESHVDRSITGPADFMHTNILGTFLLLEAARENDSQYIQVSSDEVYGSIAAGSFSERDPLDPSSPYSASKAAADLLVNAYHKTYGLKTVITRSTNNYGPRQYPEKLIPVLINKALNNEPLPIYGNGKNIRDWMFVEDNCEAIELAARKGKSGGIYNIAGGEELENLEIAQAILYYLKKPKSLISFVTDRLGHDFRYSVDDKKMLQLGWKPKTAFKDGLGPTIEWYIHNRRRLAWT